MYNCPACRRYSALPNGRQNADWLLVGEYPSYDDVKIGLPFTGKVGEFLSYELARVGIQLSSCRLVTAYPHLDSTYECLQEHFSKYCLPDLLIPRKGILLIGNTLHSIFFQNGRSIKDMQGLQMGGLDTLDIKGNVVCVGELWGSINGYLGEFRLALKNFRGGV